MRLPLFQVDAFTSNVFSGNPAAVCPLPSWLPDELMQQIAAENNLAETAFFVGQSANFNLRWFTPTCEVDLCGHATLASAYVLWMELANPSEILTFHTRSGPLQVQRAGPLLTLDLPARAPEPVQNIHPDLIHAMGGRVQPLEVLAARDYLVRYAAEQDVVDLKPDFGLLASADRFAVIATAPGSGPFDFVSRFFAPARGISEDPVTGSAHSTLVPYWAKQTGKTAFKARQVSKRGGELLCELKQDRVFLSGKAALYLTGQITIPDPT